MKHIFYCFLIALIGWPIGACADGGTRQWLMKLDQSLANRDAYEQKRVGRIDALKKELSQLDKKNTERYYEYLFWEGTRSFDDYVFEHAACVSSEDTAAFLEEYLEAAGLNDREIDDFISYWLPRLQASSYNLISFPSEEYCNWAMLDVDPAPDTLIRVYMVFAPLKSPVEIPDHMALELPDKPERHGFTVVEWGGSVLNDQYNAEDIISGN